jgi:hypothetical protein
MKGSVSVEFSVFAIAAARRGYYVVTHCQTIPPRPHMPAHRHCGREQTFPVPPLLAQSPVFGCSKANDRTLPALRFRNANLAEAKSVHLEFFRYYPG